MQPDLVDNVGFFSRSTEQADTSPPPDPIVLSKCDLGCRAVHFAASPALSFTQIVSSCSSVLIFSEVAIEAASEGA
jgi:hypothetical protein